MGILKEVIGNKNVYYIKTIMGAEHYFLANNNRDAMKTTGEWVNKNADIVCLRDMKGNTIVHN